ncbi:hypothetical protein A0H81_11328 [Grifola frondosa]|uniref:YEATS domain-containing protein n=1 Tax=Grifola frondosa TaxID=5627 RepID=A0A1C7LVK7_GRIFR|nr:hypothetical protein A0H81_11328 [Grifola frondosa]
MPYTHRNVARAELDEVVPVPPAPSHTSEGPQKADIVDDDINPPSQSSGLHLLSGSRFHIAARIQVADYSFWIPAVRRSRSNQDHSHRWRLTVSSPSYSLDITTFLTKLTVTCLTDPSPSTFVEPIIITDPPFVVGGTTDRPFLAKLTFTWAGSMNAPLEIEHWVELDPVHVSHPVLGDEQVFDVELDRNMEFLPAREDSRPVTWEDEQATSNLARSRNKVDGRKDQVVVEPDYVVKLRSLLPRVPVTAKDVKGRLSGRLPYTLVTTPAQLRNLVIGRRKAIEMGRARALRDAYQRLVTSELQQESGFTPLTTADVYRWLEDEGLFHHSTGSKHKDAPQKSQDERQEEVLPIHPDREVFCRTCGLHQSHHPAVIKSEYPGDTKIFRSIQPGPRISGTSPCMSFNGESTRLPLLDIERLLNPASNNVPYGLCPAVFAVPPPVISHGYIPSSSDLVSIGDPKLISAIRALAGIWKLEHLGWEAETTPENDHLSSRTELDRPKAVIDDQLAPFSVLAMLTKLFVRLLVHRGMDAFYRDEAATRTIERYDRSVRRPGWGADSSALRRLLTPSHVLRGLATHVQHGLTDSAVFLCLARMGEPSPQLMVPKDCSHDALTRSRHNHTTQNPPWDGKPNSPDVVVKTEEQ